ncbi:uncharacterized protein [Triticum aestivum]|uniref:uncharacterized protein n=1 Tax=Triticum aestivum TaxID=4565 RepID=UPI001D020051|nr:uncharacterized protein LOC123119020 [Triticum aestivum]
MDASARGRSDGVLPDGVFSSAKSESPSMGSRGLTSSSSSTLATRAAPTMASSGAPRSPLAPSFPTSVRRQGSSRFLREEAMDAGGQQPLPRPVPVSNSPRILLKVGSGGDDDEGAEHATADSSVWRRTARAVSHHLLCKQVAAPPGSSRRPCRAPNPPSAASSTMTPSSPASSTRRQGHNRMRTGEIELLLKSGPRRREVAFNMVDCDFKVFEGKWSVQEHGKSLLHGTMAN